MTPDEFKRLYVGDYPVDPMEKYTDEELRAIERDRCRGNEQRRHARKIRMRRQN